MIACTASLTIESKTESDDDGGGGYDDDIADMLESFVFRSAAQCTRRSALTCSSNNAQPSRNNNAR